MCIYIYINIYIYICVSYNGIQLSHKRKEILLFVITWMGFEGIMLSEINRQRKTNTV